MSIKIALAGNPNSGKTTLFNALTGSNQYVGNWPGVTVEKKEGKLKRNHEVIITDLPGIYSLSPYTLEEVVARNYLINEKPDAILNIIDGTNLERNLYLTTQLAELGIPMVLAVNMIDVVKRAGDIIDIEALSKNIGCKAIEISALKGTGIEEATEAVIAAANSGRTKHVHTFSGPVEHALAHIEEAALSEIPEKNQRWYAVKVFERDKKVIEALNISPEVLKHIESDIADAENDLDDDAESIITNERYEYIGSIIDSCYTKKTKGKLSVSDKIDRVLTNRILGLPIFAAIMFCIYYVSMVTVGSGATNWVNDGVFGDGWHLFGNGTAEYEEAAGEFDDAHMVIDAFVNSKEYGNEAVAETLDSEAEDYDGAAAVSAVAAYTKTIDTDATVSYDIVNDEDYSFETVEFTGAELSDANTVFASYNGEAPEPSDYGIWVPSIPAALGSLFEKANVNPVVSGLVLKGIVAGVGSVLGFVPQMLVLFIFLAFLEGCGYMARIAFVLDRIFRKFGLSGKSFIPILVGTGCGVPGIMASRTIESEKDRRMTIVTTTFIPCGAKQPFIAMIAGALFGNSPFIAVGAYFIGMAAIVCSGIILKKTKRFAGKATPFVMELPAYHLPTVGSVLRSMWERGWSFIKRAGTIILLSTIVIWFLSNFGFAPDGFRMLDEAEVSYSILASVGGAISFIFAPLGWGTWQATISSITGLVAKENIVGTIAVLYGGGATVHANLAAAFTVASGFSFLLFNLLCAPCFAAIGAIKREMNSAKWTWFAIGYQCLFAYLAAFTANNIIGMFTGSGNIAGFIIAIAVIVFFLYMLLRKDKYADYAYAA